MAQKTNWDVLVERVSRNRVLVTAGIVTLLITGTLGLALLGGSEKAPEFTVTTTGYVDGKEETSREISLSDYRGKVIILDLMAEWCGPCGELATDTLKPLYDEEYKDNNNVVIISVSVAGDEIDILKDIQVDEGYNWIHATDGSYNDEGEWVAGVDDVLIKYSAQMIPKVLVIDQQGRVTFSHLSLLEKNDLKLEVDKALAGQGDLVKIKESSVFLMAIGAGVLAFFSPCSFPLLPGYVSFYLTNKKTGSGSLTEQTARDALPAGLAAAAGIMSVFLLLAILVVPFAHLLADFVPFLELVVGVSVFALGLSMLLDYSLEPVLQPMRKISGSITAKVARITQGYPTAVAERGIGKVTGSDFSFAQSQDGELIGQYWYGVGYGSASAGCTAPVFIALILASMKYTFLGALLVFGLYSFSAAALMVVVTLLVASSEDTIVNRLRASTHQIHKVGGSVMVIVGLYLIWYYVKTNLL